MAAPAGALGGGRTGTQAWPLGPWLAGCGLGSSPAWLCRARPPCEARTGLLPMARLRLSGLSFPRGLSNHQWLQGPHRVQAQQLPASLPLAVWRDSGWRQRGGLPAPPRGQQRAADRPDQGSPLTGRWHPPPDHPRQAGPSSPAPRSGRRAPVAPPGPAEVGGQGGRSGTLEPPPGPPRGSTWRLTGNEKAGKGSLRPPNTPEDA